VKPSRSLIRALLAVVICILAQKMHGATQHVQGEAIHEESKYCCDNNEWVVNKITLTIMSVIPLSTKHSESAVHDGHDNDSDATCPFVARVFRVFVVQTLL